MLPDRVQDFHFLLFEGFSNMVLANAMEPLRDVKLRSSFAGMLDWRTASLDGQSVVSSSGLSIEPDEAFDEHLRRQVLILVAGYGVPALVNDQLIKKIRQAARQADVVVGVDTAPWLLAQAGLLDNREATIHWEALDVFSDAFPKVKVRTLRFMRSGKFITCGGASTVLDLTLDLVRERFGEAAAFQASTMFIYDPERQPHLNRGPSALQNKASPVLLDALNVMAKHVEQVCSIDDIARQTATSARTLNRVFLNELGMAPGKYYQMLRLQRARNLAQETDLSIEQIALRTGFSSASSLSRAFSNSYQTSIRKVRSVRAC